MFCKECGNQLTDTVSFCKACGTAQSNDGPQRESARESVESSDDIHQLDEISTEEQDIIVRKHKIFQSKEETLIDTLGSGFLSSLFASEGFNKTVIFCSDKRVYQRGKLFYRNPQGRIMYLKGEKIVDLREITSLTYYIDNPISRFRLIVPLFILGLIGLVAAFELIGREQFIVFIMSCLLMGLGIGSLITYGLKKSRMFVIEYAGGEIMTNCNWYTQKAIKRFMRNISKQKDEVLNRK